MNRRREAGFTLIEVLLAVAIGAILLTTAFASLDTALTTRRAVADHSTPYAVGPAILDALEADLRNAHFYDMKENDAFWGVDGDLLGREADALSFVTASLCKVGEPELKSTVMPGRADSIERRSPMTEVQYVCRRGPNGTGEIELWRREDFYVDDSIHDGGIYRLVYDRVYEFKLEYVRRDSGPTGSFGGDRNIDGMRADGWNAIEERGLPRAVIATLSIFARESEEQSLLRAEPRVFVFRRWIPLPQVHETAKAERDVATYDGRLSERGSLTGSGGGAGSFGDLFKPK
jgi:prepilin-type N-terminal cleavage/methylation domain-containing protein